MHGFSICKPRNRMGLNGNIYIIEHRGCWINLRISQIPPDAAEKKRGYTVMQRKRRCVKALNVFFIVCLLAGCRSTAGAGSREPGRPKEEDISSTGRPGGDNGQNSADKEDGAGGSRTSRSRRRMRMKNSLTGFPPCLFWRAGGKKRLSAIFISRITPSAAAGSF